MAIDGTYNVSVKIPTGEKKGKFIFMTDGDTLTGSLESPAGVSPIQNGVVKGDEFEFQFDAKSPMGTLKLTVKGRVNDNALTGQLASPLGQAPIIGQKAD